MPSFIQISDPHIVTDGAMVCGHSDTASALKRAIATINEMLPRLNNVDCAIVTGDLTDHGTPEEYAHFTQLMAALQLPWMAVPGNHDRRDAMRAAFEGRDWMTGRGPVQWHRDFGAFSLIGLDTLVDGAHHGRLCAQGLDFVDATLRAIGDQPAVIATHHPWIASGVPAIDADNLHNGDVLLERLAAHPAPVRMISGHVHRAVTGQVGPVLCQISPATCHSVALDFRLGIEDEMILEPGAVTLFAWHQSAAGGLVSNIIPTGDFPGPWPFHD